MTDKLIEAMARGIFDRGKLLDADECTELAQAALAAHAEWMKAEGKIVVPEVPTEAMMSEGGEKARAMTYNDHMDSEVREDDLDLSLSIWNVMIAAAKGEA